MAYDQRSSCVIGVVLLICGSVSAVLGITAMFVATSGVRWIAAPVWSGVIAALAGLMGLLSGKRKTFPGACTIKTLLTLNVVTIMSALANCVLSILGLLHDGAAADDVIQTSRATYAVCLMMGVTEVILASSAVIMGCAGACCLGQDKKSHSETSDSESGELHTLQPGDHVIEAADGSVVIVSEGQVIHPNTRQIKILAKENKSIPPPYGVGSIDAADVLRPQAVLTSIPPSYTVDNDRPCVSRHEQGGNSPSDPPDILLKQPPTDYVEADMTRQLPNSSASATAPPSDQEITEL